ncbi:MAG TPA: hypothetical protein VM618_01010, partial [Acidimicrobiia bacterium]|nr:hypothetical protein [Acidimicrobiia bacterium]
PVTGVWGEPFDDADGDGCYDAPGETHTDQVWNHAGDGGFVGAFSVRGVTIVGDPQSAGKWDGLWGGAGFGSQCAEGVFDDTWARAVVFDNGRSSVAVVSLDVVGFFNIEVQRARRELAARYPEIAEDLEEIVIASTHTHEGVDTMGYWGQTLGVDGKSPAYQAFIRSQVLDAIHDAWMARRPAQAKFARTEHTVGVRDSRDPQVMDPYAYSAQFVADDGSGDVLGTIVNWSNHPEALGGNNGFISSDFPHGTREAIEARYGGTAVYFSGSVGGLMTPLRAPVVDPKTGHDYGTGETLERAYAIGRILAEAVSDDLDAAEFAPIDGLSVESRELFIGTDNTALSALNAVGVFDVPSFVGGESWGSDRAFHRPGVPAGRTGTQFRTEMVRVEVGPAMFLTVPGELFPELEVGFPDPPVARCAEANTGAPLEPVISEHDDAQYQFVLGLAQDELGYIVPRYDHWFFHAPGTEAGNGDGIVPVGALEAEDPCGEGHYEETVSASSALAPWTTCVAAELAGRDDVWHEHSACSYANTHTTPHGLAGSVVDRYGIGSHPGHDHGHQGHGHGRSQGKDQGQGHAH